MPRPPRAIWLLWLLVLEHACDVRCKIIHAQIPGRPDHAGAPLQADFQGSHAKRLQQLHTDQVDIRLCNSAIALSARSPQAVGA